MQHSTALKSERRRYLAIGDLQMVDVHARHFLCFFVDNVECWPVGCFKAQRPALVCLGPVPLAFALGSFYQAGCHDNTCNLQDTDVCTIKSECLHSNLARAHMHGKYTRARDICKPNE